MAKRDFERIREILLHVEGLASEDGWVWIRGDDFFVESDTYQIVLMDQADFSESDTHVLGSFLPGKIRITFSGHDYLDSIKNEGVWKQTKEALSETGGSAAFEVIKALAVALAKKKIEQHTGLEI